MEPNFKLNKKKYPYIKLIKITSEKELYSNVKNFSDKIISIKIIECESKIDLSIFKEKKFLNLKELTLRNIHCKNILSLSYCNFPSLEILDLEKSDLDNTIIKLLDKLNLKNLTFLNLYSNKITNLKIFDVVKKFKKIKVFFIGENPFNFSNNSKSFYKLPESTEEFGITGNLDEKSANFINKVGIANLKIFYFCRNKIKTLKYLEKIKFKRLEEFWAICNQITDITEIMYLRGKKNIKIINLKENQINNFDELIKIIRHFPKLEKLILKNNGIKSQKALKMKDTIKKEFKNNFEIII